MRSRTVAWLRQRAASDVAGLRRDLVQLEEKNLGPEVLFRERRRLETEIIRVYDEARRLAGEAVGEAREAAVKHRPAARRAQGAFGNPERTRAVAEVAREMAPADLLRLARLAVEDDDAAAQAGLFRALAERGVDKVELWPALAVLNGLVAEETRYAADLLLAQFETALLNSDEVQARSATTKLDAALRARTLEALRLDFGESDVVHATEADVRASREALGVPHVPAAFLVAEPLEER